MMNKILLGVNAFLVLAVAYLFYKTSGTPSNSTDSSNQENKTETEKPVEKKEVPVTGKIAFVNIDSINEKSLFVDYMVRKLKTSRANLEAAMENLSMQYQKKMEEYQASANAGIAPESELAAKAKEIRAIENEANNKQLQMDNLTRELNEKNNAFQEEVRKYIKETYEGKYDYVLTYSEAIPSMLYGNSAYDITSEVIYALNENYKKKNPKK